MFLTLWRLQYLSARLEQCSYDVGIFPRTKENCERYVSGCGWQNVENTLRNDPRYVLGYFAELDGKGRIPMNEHKIG